MKTRHFPLVIILILSSLGVHSQSLTQTIRGRVTDKASQMSLPGATVILEDITPLRGAITDAEGNFLLENIPVGRHTLSVTYIGYNQGIVAGLVIGSGREVFVEIGLDESVNELGEVVVQSHTRKDKPLNSMAGISARSFTVDETRRYAGGMDDPARMAASFAGVASGNMQDNAIVIRGNSPRGVLWRVEGVEVPNPNHFSGGNVAGGGFVNTISGMVMANSDFYTGAFPAEYGNALAGVFDIKLRTGNTQKQEYAFQAGLHGIDMAGEGPFKKGSNASYLFNYRYSTFGLLSLLGALPSAQIPIYQDLTFKINMPTSRAGVFSMWGTGGIDKMTDSEETDPLLWEHNMDRYKNNWDEKFGALGINNRYLISNQTYINTSLVGSGNIKMLHQQIIDDQQVLQNDMDITDNTGKITLATFVNTKFNAKHTNRTGVNLNALFFDLDLNGSDDGREGTYRNFVRENGQSFHTQFYSQSKYNFSDQLWLNLGIHSEYFALNNSLTIDPRVGLSWEFSPKQAFHIGYGRHSQMESLKFYFINYQQDGSMVYPNKELSFSHAHHIVLGYDLMIRENVRLKVEPYFQYLFDVPGVADSWISLINFKQDFGFRHSLANNTTGKNIGVDVTFERFIKNNFYYLVTASVYDSKYKADDNIWRNTPFNKAFVANILAGKEFYMGRNNNNILGLNIRLNISGGERSTPLFFEESNEQQHAVYDTSRAFELKEKSTAFLYLSITYRTNKPGYSSIWALQVNNVLGTPQNREYVYNYKNQQMQMLQDTFIIPGISYKIEF